jgi:hypothetical protein
MVLKERKTVPQKNSNMGITAAEDQGRTLDERNLRVVVPDVVLGGLPVDRFMRVFV